MPKLRTRCHPQGAFELKEEQKVNPPGPAEKPEGCRIECSRVSDTQMLFHIPASGRGMGLLGFGIVWTLFIGVFTSVFLFAHSSGQKGIGPLLFLIPFWAVGIGMLYAGVRSKYAVHLLYLSSDQVRLQRQLFNRKKNMDLPTAEIESVRRKEFYKRNYQPVYGIEIRTPKKSVRFGTSLTEAEQHWIVWEARNFLAPFSQLVTADQ